MASPFLDDEEIPLTRVVGGNVSLSKLIEELEEMYPDIYPDYTISERQMAYHAGAVAIIRYLKSKV